MFDVFPDDAGREAHLAGPVAQAPLDAGGNVFAGAPLIQELDVLAGKLPATSSGEPVTKALLLTFKAKAGHERQVARFLRDAQALVEHEPKTVARLPSALTTVTSTLLTFSLTTAVGLRT